MTKLLIFIFEIISIIFIKYLLILIDTIEKNEVSNIKYRNIKKGENKIVKIMKYSVQ